MVALGVNRAYSLVVRANLEGYISIGGKFVNL